MPEIQSRSVDRINPSQRLVLQARADMFSAGHALAEASQLSTNNKTGLRLARLARAAILTAEYFARICRELGRGNGDVHS